MLVIVGLVGSQSSPKGVDDGKLVNIPHQHISAMWGRIELIEVTDGSVLEGCRLLSRQIRLTLDRDLTGS